MKLKIDPKKVEYDGHSARLIINDHEALNKKLMDKQKEILKFMGVYDMEQSDVYLNLDELKILRHALEVSIEQIEKEIEDKKLQGSVLKIINEEKEQRIKLLSYIATKIKYLEEL